MRNQYNKFAAEDPRELTNYLTGAHINNWDNRFASSSLFSAISSTWDRNTMSYYSPLFAGQSSQTSLDFMGDQGELVSMVVPEARVMIRQLTALITKQRLAMECLATSEDAKTLEATRLGKAILGEVIEKQQFQKKLFSAAEQGYVKGAGYLSYMWRQDKGSEYSAGPQNQVNYTGGIFIGTHGIRDVVYDWTIQNWLDQLWVVVRCMYSRWDAISMFPDAEAQILSAPSVYDSRKNMRDISFTGGYQDTEYIYINQFYHISTPSIPRGRMTYFLEDGTPLLDDENLYECLPIYQFKFEDVMDTGLGYPLLSTLLPAQEMMDNCYSVQATNISAFGTQSVLVPKGADISAHDIAGMNFITYKPVGADGGGKPEPLQLTSTPKELPDFRRELSGKIQSNSGLTGAIRGEAPQGITAGTAIATLSANAQEFLTAASMEVIMGAEHVFYGVIKCYQKFAKIPQIVSIVGDQEAYLAKEFVGSDLDAIKRVRIRTQSPLMNSVAGRTQVADALLQQGLISNPQAYVGLIEGAPLETLFDTELSENMAVQAERDALIEGKPVNPLITDNHPLFIRSDLKLLYNPDIRNNPELTKRVTDVIQDRVRLEQMCPPDLKAMLRTGQAPQLAAPAPGGQEGGSVPPQDQGQDMMDVQEPSAQVASPAVAPASV